MTIWEQAIETILFPGIVCHGIKLARSPAPPNYVWTLEGAGNEARSIILSYVYISKLTSNCQMCSLRCWLSKLFQGMPQWTPSACIWHLPRFPPGMAGHPFDSLLSMCHSLCSICQWHQTKYSFCFCLCHCCVHCLSDRVQLVHHRGPTASWSLHRVCERKHIQ